MSLTEVSPEFLCRCQVPIESFCGSSERTPQLTCLPRRPCSGAATAGVTGSPPLVAKDAGAPIPVPVAQPWLLGSDANEDFQSVF